MPSKKAKSPRKRARRITWQRRLDPKVRYEWDFLEGFDVEWRALAAKEPNLAKRVQLALDAAGAYASAISAVRARSEDA